VPVLKFTLAHKNIQSSDI